MISFNPDYRYTLLLWNLEHLAGLQERYRVHFRLLMEQISCYKNEINFLLDCKPYSVQKSLCEVHLPFFAPVLLVAQVYICHVNEFYHDEK